MSNFTALLASGLAEGAIAALAAVGFLLTYKATGVINFAQGALITLGAYVAIWVTQKGGMFGSARSIRCPATSSRSGSCSSWAWCSNGSRTHRCADARCTSS